MEVLNLEKWESFPWWLRLLQLLKWWQVARVSNSGVAVKNMTLGSLN